MDPKISDDAVGRLPIAAGRAELLEEIMSTPVTDRPTAPAPARRPRTTWLVPLAAAAAVAAVATGPLWWPSDGGSSRAPGGPAAPAAPTPGPAAYRAVLEVPGWSLTHVYEGGGGDGGEVTYEREGASLEVHWRPGDAYEGYVEDRRHIVDPPADGAPLQVLGLASQRWSYSDDDHTVIRPVENGFLLEVRGSGMPLVAFEDLLDELRLVDEQGFEEALPDRFVTASERPAVVEEMLTGIAEASGQERTPGEEGITSDQADRYHLGAEVAGQVACAWLEELRVARRLDDGERAQVAVDVLASSRRWPVLLEMTDRGDYPEAVWGYADTAARGEVPEGFRGGLGC